MSSHPEPSGGASPLVVPGFELIGELGRGGMGVVHLARDEQLGRFVAVKVLSAGRLSHPSAAERLRREAKALSQLSHPGIVTVHAFAMTARGPCIVMEYVSGASLGTLLEAGPIDTSAWIELLAQAADALDTAHRAGVVHRDVKPSNLLVIRDGARQTLKVIDFGLASLRADTSDRLTRAGAYVGTPSYASPEQALGHDVDGRADVYSLAVVALEGLTAARLTRTGVEPGSDLSHALDRPSLLGPDVERVFARALALRPDDRPPTPTAFVSALRTALQQGEPEVGTAAPHRTLQSASGFHAVLRVELHGLHEGATAGERACLDAIALAVERADGVIGSVIEGALVAVFGAATGTLHPAEQAVRAGFEARARLAATFTEARPRIAIAGAFSRMEASRSRLLSATGPAFAEARALCRLDAGALLVTPAVYARARGVVSVVVTSDVLPADALAVEPSGVERDLGEPDFYGVPIPFVGRDADLATLLAHVDDVVLRRQAQVLMVEGGQGFGRTRLLRELTAALATRTQLYLLEFVRLVGEDGLEEGFLRSLRARAGIGPHDAETAVRLKLDFALRRAGAALDSGDGVLLDRLAALLLNREGAGAPLRADGFVATLGAYFRKLAEAGPLIVLIDDLHLGGPDATLILQRLLLTVRESPVAVVASRLLRPESAVDYVSAAATHRLDPLDDAAARALASALVARAGPAASTLIDGVVGIAAGVPARLEQRLHDLVDRGVLTPGPHEWALDLERAAGDLEGEAQRRLDGLAHLSRRTLEAAAVAGDPCWREQLDAMLDESADVQGLVDHGLLRLSGDARLPGAQALELAAPSLRDGLLAGLQLGARRALHERAARFLSDRLATLGLSMVETLVRHLDGAGLPEDALQAAIRGAERASRANQPAKSVALYDRAMTLSTRLGRDLDALVTPWLTELLLAGELLRVVAATEGKLTEGYLATGAERLLLRGRALERLGRFEGAEAAYHDAALVAGDATGRRARVAEAALASKRGSADVLMHLEALAADESGDESADSEAHRQLGNALLRAGRYDLAEQALARAAELAESADDVAAELEAQNALAAAAYFRGELTLALKRFGAALRLAERGQMVQHEALINNNLAELQLALGEVGAASASAAKALVLYRALGSDEGIADAARIASECARARGDDGRTLAEESLGAARRTGVARLIAAAEAQVMGASGSF